MWERKDKRMDTFKEKGALIDTLIKGATSECYEREMLGVYILILLELQSEQNIKWERPYKNLFKEIEKDEAFQVWNEKQIKDITKWLKYGGVILSGGAGTGKGYLAKNIAFQFIDELGYKSVLYSELGSGPMTPNKIGYGDTITGNYELGIILEGAILAKDNPDKAVVVLLDEITRADFLSCISKLFNFLSEKGKSNINLTGIGEITYQSNLFIICTANEGAYNKTDILSDEALLDRLHKIPVVGVFENEETLNKFLSAYKEKINNTYKEILLNIYKVLEENKDSKWYSVAREISTRKLIQCMDIPDNAKITPKDYYDELYLHNRLKEALL
jgi:MoxR-like ATPase